MNNGGSPNPSIEVSPIKHAPTAEYSIPAATAEAEIEIKKSRFIARACYSASREQALGHLAQAQKDFPDARHHCWAYLLGPPHSPSSAAMSDDGEPSGTAGKPILNVLQHKDVGDIMLIVIRYFGGIKLGAGGLVRAYGQAAQAVIDVLEIEKRIPMVSLSIFCDFSQEQPVRHWIDVHQGSIDAVGYANQVALTASLPASQVAEWQAYAEGQGIAVKID